MATIAITSKEDEGYIPKEDEGYIPKEDNGYPDRMLPNPQR